MATLACLLLVGALLLSCFTPAVVQAAAGRPVHHRRHQRHLSQTTINDPDERPAGDQVMNQRIAEMDPAVPMMAPASAASAKAVTPVVPISE